jgi:hypothetical protein
MPGATPKGYPYPLGTDLVSSGDNTIQALATFLDGQAGTRASGTITANVSVINTPVSVAVTYPVGRFTATPQVMATARAANPQTTAVGANGHSASGVNIFAARVSGTANPSEVDWFAVQA